MTLTDRIAGLLNLDGNQKAIAFAEKSRAVSAGAGSGKTRTLVARFLYLLSQTEMQLDRIAAITFTERAANELRERIRAGMEQVLRESGPAGGLTEEALTQLPSAHIGTIHAFCARLLREAQREARLPADFEIMEAVESQYALEQAVARAVFALHDQKDVRIARLLEANEFRLVRLMEQIVETVEAVRARHIPLEKCRVPAGDSASPDEETEYTKLLLEIARESAAGFQKEKRRSGVLDFDDLLEETQKLLTENEPVAEAFARRYRHLLVDEFQDTDRRQDAIFESLRRHGATVFLVGDPKQSIYRFRGSEVAVFQKARERMEGPPAALSKNYRATPALVESFNQLFPRLFEESRSPEVAYEPMESAAGTDDRAPLRVIVNPGEALDEVRDREPRLLVELVEEIHRAGTAFGEIGVLFRNFSRVRAYERELRRAGIPYHTVSGRGFWETAEVADVLAFLRALLDPTDRIAWASVLKSPFASTSDDSLYLHFTGAPFPEELAEEGRRIEDVQRRMGQLRDGMTQVTPERLLERVLEETQYLAAIGADADAVERMGNLRKLVTLASHLTRHGRFGTTVLDFVDYLEMFRDRGSPEGEARVDVEGEDAVRLTTVHAAKGLEFEAVILPDTLYKRPRDDRVLVSSRGEVIRRLPEPADGERPEQPLWERLREAERRAAREEEKRVFYVALTRAKRQVSVILNLPLRETKAGFKLPFGADNDDCFAAMLCRTAGIHDWLEADRTRMVAQTEKALKERGFALWRPGEQEPRGVGRAIPSESKASALADLGKRLEPIPAMVLVRVTDLVEKAESENREGDAAGLGDPAHRFLALWNFEEATADPALWKVGREFGLSKKQMDRLRKMATAFLKSPLRARIGKARAIHKELDLAAVDSEEGPGGSSAGGRVLIGRADLVLEFDDGFALYDYKWMEEEGQVEPYEIQLQTYAELLKRRWPACLGAHFVFLPAVRLVPVRLPTP